MASPNALRDAIVARIQAAAGPQTSTQIVQGIALAGLVAQELQVLVAAGVLTQSKDGFTSKASMMQQLAAKEMELQNMRLAVLEQDAAPAVAAPVVAAPVVAAPPATVAG